MRSFLSLTAAVLLVSTLSAAVADAAPRPGRKHQRRSYSWKSHQGPRVTVGSRFRGHGHAAPIKRTPRLAVAKHPKLSPKIAPKHAPKQTIKTATKGHFKHHHKHFTWGRRYLGGRHVVPGARIVIPATSTEVLVYEPSEQMVVVTPELEEETSSELWQVESVIDGARMVVRREGQIQQVRLLGVSIPAVEEDACGKYLESLAVGKSVMLLFDETIAPQDSEGITTAYVYLADASAMLNLEMIRAGRGLAEGGYEHEYTELFVAAQAEARDTKQGIWAGVAARTE